MGFGAPLLGPRSPVFMEGNGYSIVGDHTIVPSGRMKTTAREKVTIFFNLNERTLRSGRTRYHLQGPENQGV